jgi:hypothetical protein
MYRAFKSQVQPRPGDQNMQLIKTLMTDCINQYNNLLPQLDMLAVHHGLPLFDEGGEVDKTTSLRLEAAQARRRQELDVNLTEQLKDVHTYIANQTQAQNTGLQRQYEYQEKCLGTREEELGKSQKSVRTEIDMRRIVEQKLSNVAEDLRLANLDVARLSKQNRESKQNERPANREAEMRGRDLGREQAQTNGEPHQSTLSDFTAQYKDTQNKSPVSAFDEMRDAAYRPRIVNHRTKTSGRDVPHNNMQMQMFNAFKDVCTAASGSVRLNLLNEEYPDGMSCDEFYDSLEKPWNIRIPEYGKIKELYKVGVHVSKFTGDRLSYASWRRKFFAMVHNQRMLLADKALALSAALDTTKEDLNAGMRGLNYDAATYAAFIRELERLYRGAEAEVALAAAELFKGGKIQLTSLESGRNTARNNI